MRSRAGAAIRVRLERLMRGARRSRLPALGLPAVGFLLLPVAAPAQTTEPAALDAAEAAADRGEVATARAALETIAAEHGNTADRADRARMSFLRARLMVDVDSAEVEYLRAAIDGEGLYASRARLRLAQLTLARGGHAAAARHLEQLRTDDPGGELTAASWVWTARAAEAAGDAAAACSAWETALTTLSASSPQREEARENRSRCEASGREPGEVETFTVQLGAFGTEEAAIRLRDGAALTGIAVRVEPPFGGVMVHRVRAGRFGSRDDAERLAARFQADGYDAVVVPEEP